MQLFRIGSERYLNNMDGRGSSYKNGARWNHEGTPVIYMGVSPAIAMLEMANYIERPELVPVDYRMAAYEVDDDVEFAAIEVGDLEDGWEYFPYPEYTQTIGTNFLDKREYLGLMVPSCTVPMHNDHGRIIVINPFHPDISKIRLVDTSEKIYNERMFGGG